MSSFESSGQPNAISVQTLRDKLNQKQKINLLDVRSPEEHEAYHLGGILIPLPELPNRLGELDPNVTWIVYCRSGRRSAQAVQFLLASHFKSVLNLEGGALAWQKIQEAQNR